MPWRSRGNSSTMEITSGGLPTVARLSRDAVCRVCLLAVTGWLPRHSVVLAATHKAP